jgi:transcriptional regulator with XRE-family HTH domain
VLYVREVERNPNGVSGSGMASSGGRVNVPALYASLNAEKERRGLSWRQLAGELDLSPSTFTRMANGHRPDVDAFAALVRWLGHPAETFIDAERDGAEPDLVASLAPLLRARKDLSEDDAKHLEELFRAAVAEFQATRALH